MKLKNKYVLRAVADKTVAIAIEKGDEKTDSIITLNETGVFIFSRINEGQDFDTIVDDFLDEYDVTHEEAEKVVSEFVEMLKANELLEDDGQKKMKL